MIDFLRTAKHGTCALLDPDCHAVKPKLISETVVIDKSDLNLLVSLLIDVNSWCFARKRCLPRSTAIVKLESKTANAKLCIGMRCADWILVGMRMRAGGFFDPVRGEIQGILKRAFPELASNHSQSMWKQGAITKLKELAETKRSRIR